MPRALPALAALLLSGGPQVTIQGPTPPSGPRPQGSADYGPPVFVELSSLAFSPETHQRRHVETRGRLDPLELSNYMLLTDGNARVLVLLSEGQHPTDLMSLIGRAVDMRGIVRMLRPKVFVGILRVDLDEIEDPTLPVLPAPDPSLPKATITALAILERDGVGAGESTRAAGSLARMILADPGRYSGQKLRLVGRFRGRNLFCDLPANSQRDPADWVLLDGDLALWVTGKRPKGKGWALDPGYAGDARHWLVVEGKPEVAGGVVYLRASRVELTNPPSAPSEPEP